MTTIDYRIRLRPISDHQFDELFRLCEIVFGPGDRLDGRWRIDNMPDLSCCEARRDEMLVGFKLGYAATSRRYYSWLGGVHPNYRRQGIASQLITLQHEWIAHWQFKVVETQVRQDNLAMAALNRAHGFVEVGRKRTANSAATIYRKYFDAE